MISVLNILEILETMSIPREQSNQNKEMKTADSVLLSLFIRDNK